MKLPVVRGTIDRRILANYRIDPIVMKELLPQPFRPKVINGFAIGGICLIRLKAIRPRFFPFHGDSDRKTRRIESLSSGM